MAKYTLKILQYTHFKILKYACHFSTLCMKGFNVDIRTAQKMKFVIKDFLSKCEEILNGKLYFLCNGK